MFETPQFREQLTQIILREARAAGMDQYENSIVEYLQKLAVENEPILMERELKKTTGRRGIPDALASAAKLVQEASRYAASDKRTTVRESDIQKAYGLKFCQVWPFCK